MTIDTSTQPFTATAEHLIDTVAQARADLATAIRKRDEARAEAAIERRLRIALDGRVGELEHQNRELRKANESFQVALAAVAPTVELPRIPAEPAPVRRRRGRGRHQ